MTLVLKEFELTFPEAVATFVKDAYRHSNVIIEYGSGGSTFVAAAASKTVITVESDQKWLKELMASYEAQNLPGHIIPLWANIGQTENWGYPEDETHWKLWSQYPSTPWQYCKKHNVAPDLVLIDGRFRVASFIACCIHTQKPITLLFDDYVEREQYHSVAAFVRPKQIIDERLAVFEINPGLISAHQLLDNLAYFHALD